MSAPSAPPAVSVLGHRRQKTLLLIEDQEPMRRNLALMLELEGYSVLTAANGADGIELAAKHQPDLVLCDVMMPGLDGFEVIQRLRNHPATLVTPFIFLTARADHGDVRKGMNVGADDYLTKPVAREDLLAAVAARLDRADRLQQTASGFNPDFSSPKPLEAGLALTPREAEVLLWVAQGKSNADAAAILTMSEKTVKQHLTSIFQKLGVESRNAASLRALEILGQKRWEAA